MAQKAAKTLATRNASRLNTAHLLTLGSHTLFLLLRLLLRFHSPTASKTYVSLSLPGLLLQIWLERLGRPSYRAASNNGGAAVKELRRAGEDMDAKGLTEWMWDVVFWTDGCVAGSAVLGDWVWWFWAAIPLYTAYLAYSTFFGARGGLSGLLGGGGGGGGAGAGADDGKAGSAGSSKRQQKMEKRGGKRVQYR